MERLLVQDDLFTSCNVVLPFRTEGDILIGVKTRVVVLRLKREFRRNKYMS